jgi:hypothetical protein
MPAEKANGETNLPFALGYGIFNWQSLAKVFRSLGKASLQYLVKEYLDARVTI